MRAARVDGNQEAIVEALRAAGCSVTVTSMLGHGFPDIIIGFRGPSGHVVLIEIKDPSQAPSDRVLTPAQKSWHRTWLGPAHVVETIDQALSIVQHYRKGKA